MSAASGGAATESTAAPILLVTVSKIDTPISVAPSTMSLKKHIFLLHIKAERLNVSYTGPRRSSTPTAARGAVGPRGHLGTLFGAVRPALSAVMY